MSPALPGRLADRLVLGVLAAVTVMAAVGTHGCGHSSSTSPSPSPAPSPAAVRSAPPPAPAKPLPAAPVPAALVPGATTAETIPCKSPAIIFAGRGYIDRLLCPNGYDPRLTARSSGSAPTAGCVTDSYHLSCDQSGGSQTVHIAGGEPPPLPPPRWILLAPSEREPWTKASEQFSSCAACSEEALGMLISAHPDAAPFFRLRGVTRIVQKRPAEAAADLDRAVALMPDYQLYRLERAEIRLQLDRTTDAIGDLLEIERTVDPSWSHLREWLGVTARTLRKAGHPRAPAFLRRACAAGIEELCGATSGKPRRPSSPRQ